jgi:phosphoribosylanthranilate isomerase
LEHNPIKVKICGITNLEDALAAAEYGADAVGFIFAAESPRFVPANQVRKIVSALPPFITTVGVFTAGDEKTIRDAVVECGIDLIQFHGPFPSEVVQVFSSRAIQVIRIADEENGGTLEEIARAAVRAFLLDTFHPELLGGSGVPFNWDRALQAKKIGSIILAGGLTPENVEEAIVRVRPFGVDVSSGVEMRKGKKDFSKMKRFIEAAKRAGEAS